MSDGEIYPNAPVVLVAFEVRHPTVGPLSHAQKTKIKKRLGATLPILRTGQLTNIEGIVGSEAPTIRTEKFPKYFSRDKTISVSLREAAIVIEATRYDGWRKMGELIAGVLSARQEIGELDGVERVGLRYIDELRVPDKGCANWEPWVDSSLLGPAQIGEKLELRPIQWQGVSVFTPGADRTVVLRYGPQEGYAVDPGGDLQRQVPTPGPFFLIDIDSFWTPSDQVPEFDVDQIAAISDELHGPIRKLFESLITDRLREEVLRRGQ